MTFRTGDTQANAFLKADGSHVSPNGIFVVSTLSFRDLRALNVVVVATKVGSQSIVIPAKLLNASVLIVVGGGGGAFAGGAGGGVRRTPQGTPWARVPCGVPVKRPLPRVYSTSTEYPVRTAAVPSTL